MQAYTISDRRCIGRKVTIVRVVGWEFILPQLTREPWEHRELPQWGLGQSDTRKLFLEYAISRNFTCFSVFWKLAVSDNNAKIQEN